MPSSPAKGIRHTHGPRWAGLRKRMEHSDIWAIANGVSADQSVIIAPNSKMSLWGSHDVNYNSRPHGLTSCVVCATKARQICHKKLFIAQRKNEPPIWQPATCFVPCCSLAWRCLCHAYFLGMTNRCVSVYIYIIFTYVYVFRNVGLPRCVCST